MRLGNDGSGMFADAASDPIRVRTPACRSLLAALDTRPHPHQDSWAHSQLASLVARATHSDLLQQPILFPNLLHHLLFQPLVLFQPLPEYIFKPFSFDIARTTMCQPRSFL